jgi:hypothetical protein
MLHCPMRTNEKVLNLLYAEVTQIAHKAEMKDTLDSLTEAIRRIGELTPSFRHKFEKQNTKLLEKIKLPYDQSRKIFGSHQLHGLRDLVHIAIPACELKRREEWMTFLYHWRRYSRLTKAYRCDILFVGHQYRWGRAWGHELFPLSRKWACDVDDKALRQFVALL